MSAAYLTPPPRRLASSSSRSGAMCRPELRSSPLAFGTFLWPHTNKHNRELSSRKKSDVLRFPEQQIRMCKRSRVDGGKRMRATVGLGDLPTELLLHVLGCIGDWSECWRLRTVSRTVRAT